MIVLDEQLNDPRIINLIAEWYPGKVIVIGDIRPGTIIKDDAIPGLLLKEAQPTFVTINYSDFWEVTSANDGYCIVCIKLPSDQKLKVTGILREVLSQPAFKAKHGRMGKVISYSHGVIEHYPPAD